MDLLPIIQKRCSCRRYDQTRTVERELIDKVLEAGRLAPSGKNTQPWHFYVITNAEKIKELGKAIEPGVIKDVPKMAGAAAEKGVSNIVFYDAPVIVNVSMNKKNSIDTRQMDIGLTVENMILMAETLGLGTLPVYNSKWYGQDLITQTCKIPEEEEFMLTLCIGYIDPAQPRTVRPRKELSQIATYVDL
ncbi:putative nitroreductase family protein [Blattamonas nauphoetae]|uniref:Nitroreductase family protein n=1 Tax=Blattamonas nauphoetae TaxID=2049346 RepID=A0ABQ9Y3I8_9EUKA|nr:putative nitroreductase family protein [Blattamonas nauphoetae]